jgi:hypothetical protein
MANEDNLIPHKKGEPKTPGSGRKEGTLNQATEMKNACEVMLANGVDPTEYLIDVLKTAKKKKDLKLQFQAASELHRYKESYKQKSEVNLKGHIDGIIIREWEDPSGRKGSQDPKTDTGRP